jgi:imidazolonepropionase-like amidohydrolase
MARQIGIATTECARQREQHRGRLGVVEEGALADLLLVDAKPLDDIAQIEDLGRSFVLIMKNCEIYKNTLAPGAVVAR